MELKSYQEQALRDLKSFLDFMNRESSISKAYAAYWEAKDVPIGHLTAIAFREFPMSASKFPPGEARLSWRQPPFC